MARDNPVSRRTALKVTGAAATTALLAGCSGGDDSGNGNGNGDGSDGYEAEAGEEIMFSGETTEWTGVKPSDIEGESNPTIILSEGEEYTFGWSEGNGTQHNIEIRDSDGNVVNDLKTELTAEPGEDQKLTFEASTEMAVYRCNPHAGMEGEIKVE
ncbi:plastocyanin/azurin family copper-binding protein [Natrinema sp. H-ect1]|uniref:cupredoxin domain-containing protein n=1 Tax=Natrinema sp. H-ect1 TaxID=3242700 RepID=UPI00359DA922